MFLLLLKLVVIELHEENKDDELHLACEVFLFVGVIKLSVDVSYKHLYVFVKF
uniref:Uncharacterized protein n=1 Tax=Arundo donax TaxID=35708 RepID=A0A0A9CJ80_ARUDO